MAEDTPEEQLETLPTEKNETPAPAPLPVEEPADDLAPIKDKLNRAFEERDRAQKELEQLRKEKREAELQRLKDEGKDREHFEETIRDRNTEIERLKSENIKLTRDNTVQRALAGLEFRNEVAADLAAETIIKSLVQDDKGNWVNGNGKSIEEFVKSYSEDEANAFLFKQPENRGSGTPPVKPAKPGTNGKKLTDLSQQEVLKMAAEGKLPR